MKTRAPRSRLVVSSEVARPSRVVSSVIASLVFSCPVVIVSQGWPSSLIAALSLGVPVEGAYFPYHLHKFFKPTKSRHIIWQSTASFNMSRHGDVIFIVSGSVDFLDDLWPKLRGTQSVIAQVITPMRDVSFKRLQYSRRVAHQWLSTRGLKTSTWSDELSGGSTDASFVFGFGDDLGTLRVPTVVPSLARRLEHVLCPTAGWWTDESATLAQCSAVTDQVPKRCGMWCEGALLPQGVYPCQHAGAFVVCPTVYVKGGGHVVRRLCMEELLRLHQLPLEMDAAISEHCVVNDCQIRTPT